MDKKCFGMHIGRFVATHGPSTHSTSSAVKKYAMQRWADLIDTPDQYGDQVRS